MGAGRVRFSGVYSRGGVCFMGKPASNGSLLPGDACHRYLACPMGYLVWTVRGPKTARGVGPLTTHPLVHGHVRPDGLQVRVVGLVRQLKQHAYHREAGGVAAGQARDLVHCGAEGNGGR